MVLSVKGLDHGLWVKCTNSREYCNLIDQSCSWKQNNIEHLKDGASEGSSSLFSKQKFLKPHGVSNIANGWEFGNLVCNIQVTLGA